ncbi:MAG: prepilin-type N-terminal cleavage/methylation domain-containing protein [Pseudomonadota bacterium]|nr:MAG: prepilin-type N-terminal cleavage/methylation domain-containing protein [Pseudomonadota bacterium]
MTDTQRGLTFIELIIGLSVLAVIVTAAIPAFGQFLERQRVTSHANSLVAHLQFARHEAIVRNAPVTACPSADGRHCSDDNRWDAGWIVYLDPDTDSQPASADRVLRVVAATNELVLHSGGRLRVRFRPDGAAYGTNLTIRVCPPGDPDNARAVIVSNPGRVRATGDVRPAECQLDG